MFACCFLRAMHLLGLKTKHEHVSKNWKTLTLYQLSHIICKTVLDLILYTYIFLPCSANHSCIYDCNIPVHPMQFSQHFFQPQAAQARVAVKCEVNSPKKVTPVVSWLEGRMQRCTTGGCLKTTEIHLSFNMCFCKSLFNTSRLNMLSNISSDMFMAKMYLYKLHCEEPARSASVPPSPAPTIPGETWLHCRAHD